MSDPFVLMHVSDLHFHHLPLNPARYLSKRALGGLNVLLRRQWIFPRSRVQRLVHLLRDGEWDHLVITGDLTHLALEEEFALARRTLEPLLARGPEHVTVIPGNHDRYVKDTPGRGRFEDFFGEFAGTGSEILTRRLTGNWWLVAWDSAVPASLLSAAGRVRSETLEATESFLAGLPADARVIVANHYPIHFPPPHHEKASHELSNLKHVREWVADHAIDLYLHGHVHHNWVMSVPGGRSELTVVNSASSTQKPRPGDRSAFHRIELRGDAFHIEPQQYD